MSGELSQARGIVARSYYKRQSNGVKLYRINTVFSLTDKEHEIMELQSRARGLTPTGLCRKIIDRVIVDDLFKAVLDD